MNRLLPAQDIPEEILFMLRTERGSDLVGEGDLRLAVDFPRERLKAAEGEVAEDRAIVILWEQRLARKWTQAELAERRLLHRMFIGSVEPGDSKQMLRSVTKHGNNLFV